MTGWRRLLAGQVDAGVSSLAGFVAALYAAHHFSPAELGAYGVFYALFGLMSQLPTQLVMSPAEALSVNEEPSIRLGLLPRSLPLGLIVGVVSAVVVPLGAFQVPQVAREVVVPLGISAALLTFLSPVQDHLRTMFHLAEQSWKSASVATAQAVGVGIGLLVLPQFGIAWAPFGAMALGNALSIAFALVIAGGMPRLVAPRLGEFWVMGRALTVAGVAGAAGNYAVVAIVEHLSGIAAVGQFEAARIVARPLQVLGLGLIAVIGPQIMTRAAARDLVGLRRTRRRYWILTLASGLVFAGLFSYAWPLNPFLLLVPNAYLVPGLAGAAVFANIAWNLAYPVQSELLAQRKQNQLARIEVATQVVRSAFAFLLTPLGPFVLPLSQLAATPVKIVSGLRSIRLDRPKP